VTNKAKPQSRICLYDQLWIQNDCSSSFYPCIKIVGGALPAPTQDLPQHMIQFSKKFSHSLYFRSCTWT